MYLNPDSLNHSTNHFPPTGIRAFVDFHSFFNKTPKQASLEILLFTENEVVSVCDFLCFSPYCVSILFWCFMNKLLLKLFSTKLTFLLKKQIPCRLKLRSICKFLVILNVRNVKYFFNYRIPILITFLCLHPILFSFLLEGA